ncbi:hypothetical protein HX039_00055 [Myroides marinus]|uniref:hypothetical protein n=1 Tax=Myroides marinus TaxID=703342 RepID=UPI002578E9B6|nr:hypothetical protein [Myroides marinus]MDM1402502.1 hypothetical protein [Myroides marinus]
MKLKLLLLSLVTFTSFAQKTDITYSHKILKTPELNEIKTADIGNPIYTNEEYQYTEGVLLKTVPNFKIATYKFNISEGKILPFNYEKKGLKLFYNKSTDLGKGAYLGIALDEKDNVYAIYDTFMYFQKKDVEGLVVEKTTYINPECDSCFRYELIYNGKSQNVLNFTYREFKGDFIRPSFNQELKYNLEDGNIIGFKTLRIEVIKTNNFGIEYKVLSY